MFVFWARCFGGRAWQKSPTQYRPENYGISDKHWRFIHYANGQQELYDIASDPFEWNNLADVPEQAERIAKFRKRAPGKFADFVPAKKQVLPKLSWNQITDEALPNSKPTGDPVDVYFNNKSSQPVEVFRMDGNRELHPYGTLERGWFKPYQARTGEVWLIADKKNRRLGYFEIGNQMAEAIIPSK